MLLHYDERAQLDASKLFRFKHIGNPKSIDVKALVDTAPLT